MKHVLILIAAVLVSQFIGCAKQNQTSRALYPAMSYHTRLSSDSTDLILINSEELKKHQVPREQSSRAQMAQKSARQDNYKRRQETVDLSALTPETTFADALEILRNSADPPLRIFVNWRDLSENADVDRTTPINMEGISGIPRGAALELLLQAVGGGFAELDYVVENGVIVIATKDSLRERQKVTVYDVSDLVGAGFQQFYGL